MQHVPSRFPHNDIMSLTSQPVRYDLAESVGPDLQLGQLFATGFGAELKDLALAYRPTDGDAALRQLIGARHGVSADDVVTTVGSMQALCLVAFILSEPGAVIARPVFPNARTALEAVRMAITELPMRFDEGYRLDFDRLRALLT